MKKLTVLTVCLALLAIFLTIKVVSQNAEIESITAVYMQTVEGMGQDLADMYNTGYAAGMNDMAKQICPTEDGEGIDPECMQMVDEVVTAYMQVKYP